MILSSDQHLRLLSPLFYPLIALIISITVHQWPPPAAILYGLLLATILFLLASWQRVYFSTALLSCLLALAGWLRVDTITNYFEQFPFHATGKKSAIYGAVINKGTNSKGRMKHTITLETSHLNGTPLDHTYAIQLFLFKETALDIGDTIVAHNIPIKHPTNRDFKKYLMKEGIAASAFVERFEYTTINKPAFSLSRWLFNCKQRILRSFKQTLSSPALAFFAALFLGEKGSNKWVVERIQKQCKQWGILHYLARSGLHLIIVLSTYEALFRLLPIPFGLKQLCLLFLSMLYFILTWPSISFVRAFLVFVFYKLFTFAYLPINFMHVLLLTCIVILITNPLQLFFLDFQLSFCLTFALAWLNQYKTFQWRSDHQKR